jgi:hypothetical protein
MTDADIEILLNKDEDLTTEFKSKTYPEIVPLA